MTKHRKGRFGSG